MSTAVPNAFMSGILAVLQRPTPNALSDQYLRAILAREYVDNGLLSPANAVYSTVAPIIQNWAGAHLSFLAFSGSYAKGTANKSGTDLDLLISLRDSCTVPLKEICSSLKSRMSEEGYAATVQNVSVGISVRGTKVDLVPARQQNPFTNDHSLYHKRTGTWRKTNVHKHVNLVSSCGWTPEIRLIKLWRDQKGLDFPSFYLELAVIRALRGVWYGTLSEHVLSILDYLAGNFVTDRFVDPANTANVISDDLTFAEKKRIQTAAQLSLRGDWSGIIR
jgi:hypothetical protein